MGFGYRDVMGLSGVLGKIFEECWVCRVRVG